MELTHLPIILYTKQKEFLFLNIQETIHSQLKEMMQLIYLSAQQMLLIIMVGMVLAQVGTHLGTINLIAGQFYLFRIRMQEVGGGAAVKFFWRKPNETTGWFQDPEEIACISSINEISRWNSSSVYSDNTFNATLPYPSTVNLYHYTGWLDSPQGWSAKYNDANQWIVYDLGSPQWILGIVTQGREDGTQFVRNAKVEYSAVNNPTSSDWVSVIDNASLNSDGTTKKIVEFPKRVYGRYVRVSPLTSGYSVHMTMRLGVIY
jgi:hypothetical protein